MNPEGVPGPPTIPPYPTFAPRKGDNASDGRLPLPQRPAAPTEFFFESRHIEQLLLPFDHAGLDYRCDPNMHTAQDPSKMIGFFLSTNWLLSYTKLVFFYRYYYLHFAFFYETCKLYLMTYTS